MQSVQETCFYPPSGQSPMTEQEDWTNEASGSPQFTNIRKMGKGRV